jgi:ABC-type multidrug transport system ATPase subunit
MKHVQLKIDEKVLDVYLYPNQPLFIGSNPTGDYKVIVRKSNIESTHYKLEIYNNNVFLTDLTSLSKDDTDNEVGLNAEALLVKPGEKYILIEDLVIYTSHTFDAVTETATLPVVVHIDDYLQGKDRITIGNNHENDIIIKDATSAAFHAEVYRKSGDLYIKDLGSASGVFINGEKIKGERKIDTEVECYIGLTALHFGDKPASLKPQSAVTAVNISKIYKNSFVGLQPMSLNIMRGEFVALMGPSGCGKSTLLKTLTGDNPCTDGQVYLFGLELKQYFKLLKKKIGYVPQEDIIHQNLTVYQTLYYAAKLRLEENLPEYQIHSRIQEVLSALKMNDSNITQRRVKMLSGGQRKRISIAVELLTKPSILFLDEPTSPLDPETVVDFLKCIKELCIGGMTVIMVTHKPEDLYYADRIVFLGNRGYHAFDGNKDEIIKYFNTQNLIEVYSLLNSEEASIKYYEKWYKDAVRPEVKQNNNLKIDRDASFWNQYKWLIKRNLAIRMGDPANLRLQVLQPLVISILIVMVFKDLIKNNIPISGAYFMMVISTIWFSVSLASREIIDEIAIFKRERMFNLKIGTYLLGKYTVLGFTGLIQTFIISAVLKASYGTQMEYWFLTWMFLWLIYLGSVSLGFLISSSVRNSESVMIVNPIVLLPQNLLAGIVAPIQDKYIEILSMITYGRWGTEGVMRINDGLETGVFTKFIINKNIYYSSSFEYFNAFGANMFMIFILSLLFMSVTVWKLNKKGAL